MSPARPTGASPIYSCTSGHWDTLCGHLCYQGRSRCRPLPGCLGGWGGSSIKLELLGVQAKATPEDAKCVAFFYPCILELRERTTLKTFYGQLQISTLVETIAEHGFGHNIRLLISLFWEFAQVLPIPPRRRGTISRQSSAGSALILTAPLSLRNAITTVHLWK